MNSNAKFGCLLYSTDLSTLYEDDMLFRRSSLSQRARLLTTNNKMQYKKSVKPIDFFLYNEIAFSNQCRINDDIYEDGDNAHFNNRFYTFSSFTLIKTKKDSVETDDFLIRSERDTGTSKIAYGAFSYAPKLSPFFLILGRHIRARTFCYTIMHIFKMTLDTLAYLKKNDAIHLGMSHESILTNTESTHLLIDGVHHIRFMKDLLKMNDKTLVYVLKSHFLNQPENKFPVAFAPVEVALLLFILNHDDLVTVSPNNIRGVIHEYIRGHNTLKSLSPAFQSDFANNCEIALVKYVNVSKNEVIKDILKSGHTWGTHALSVIFLSILMTMNGYTPSLMKTGFYNKWFKLLIMNMHPSPLKRKPIDETIGIFAKISRVSAFAEHVNSLKELDNEKAMVGLTRQFRL